MFPAIRIKVSGLKPQRKYIMMLDIQAVDDNRYRYVYHSSKVKIWILFYFEIYKNLIYTVHPICRLFMTRKTVHESGVHKKEDSLYLYFMVKV